ncbi:uncharacterized protein F5147DRAFT_816264 [Suillus discolor]|uniref:Uncharacterized protein n=1 Tax=Suillus discolor TaxID=1912936 RepID=A0A9P7EZZ1_9AGAM|nr:uncharacterized protein F5147DRAFT_816264 [Suillus discolor]KAG2097992.1 hypothetical protein F5147DRAFT_816264 [Suillus discolor]
MPIKHRCLSAKSPCFVHSHLDKGASLQDWLDIHTKDNEVPGSGVGVAKALQQHHRPQHHLEFSYPDEVSEDDDSDTYGGNLAKQLAEAAVGVREMSKQLGRARIKSNIQNVLIVTKPRDNCLINLTHELALYLMLKHREGGQGLIVPSTAHSRRFDAEGLQRDHPELFEPLSRRRSSSSNSLSSLSSSSTHQDDFNTPQEDSAIDAGKVPKKGETGEIMMKDANKGRREALEGGWSGGFTTSEGNKCLKDEDLTPAGFLHEFATSDPSQSGSQTPSHKFHNEGRENGTGTTKHGSFKFPETGGHYAWSFRSRSHEDMMEWWNDARILCARYLVAIEAAVRSAGYVSDEEDEEDGSSIEQDQEDEDEDNLYEDADAVVDDEEDHKTSPSYSNPTKNSFNGTHQDGYALDKRASSMSHDDSIASSRQSKRQQEKASEGRPSHDQQSSDTVGQAPTHTLTFTTGYKGEIMAYVRREVNLGA